jgi:phage terminase small subunit
MGTVYRNEYGLTSMEERFCEEFLRDYRAGAAIKRAGFKKKQPNNAATKLMRRVDIRARIDTLQAEALERCRVSADWVISQLVEVVNFDIRRLITWTNAGLRLKSSSELSIEEARMVEQIEEKIDQQGNRTWKVKRASRSDALKALSTIFAHREEGANPRGFARKLQEVVKDMRTRGGPGGSGLLEDGARDG